MAAACVRCVRKKPGCILLENAAHPILQCEQFESDYKELCDTCDRLTTWTYPKPKGIVW